MSKKKVIISVVIIIVVIISVVAVALFLDFKENKESQKPTVDNIQVDFSEWKNGTLIVNGKVCENAIVRIHPDGYAVIPILRIVNELGGTVKWKNKDTAVIKCNGVKYTLNTKENTLIKSGMNYSIFDALGGKAKGVPYFAKEGDDYIAADEWASPFLSDINVFKHIDSEQCIVYIDTKDNQ